MVSWTPIHVHAWAGSGKGGEFDSLSKTQPATKAFCSAFLLVYLFDFEKRGGLATKPLPFCPSEVQQSVSPWVKWSLPQLFVVFVVSICCFNCSFYFCIISQVPVEVSVQEEIIQDIIEVNGLVVCMRHCLAHAISPSEHFPLCSEKKCCPRFSFWGFGPLFPNLFVARAAKMSIMHHSLSRIRKVKRLF